MAKRVCPGPFSSSACDVDVTDDELVVSLADGRRVSAPLVWFPRLLHASPEARADWRLIGDGIGIHWSQVDEDISVKGLLRGIPSIEFKPSGGRDAQ
jgi:Protein of unknown function (DUF2442)